MGQKQVVKIPVGGMFLAGDLASAPQGSSLLARNVLFRPGNRIEARPVYKAVTLSNFDGGGYSATHASKTYWFLDGTDWTDAAIQRFAVKSQINSYEYEYLGVWDETAKDFDCLQGSDKAVCSGVLKGWAQWGDTVYILTYTSWFPYPSYDPARSITLWKPGSQTSVADDVFNPFKEGDPVTNRYISGNSIACYIDRLFFGGHLSLIRNLLYEMDISAPYFSSGLAGWATSNATWSSDSFTNDYESTTGYLYKIAPDAGTTTVCYAQIEESDGIVIDTRSVDEDITLDYMLLTSFSNLSEETCGLTVTVRPTYPWKPSWNSFPLGYTIVPTVENGFRYRCIQADNTTGVTEPTWPTTVGETVNDPTASDHIWECVGPDTYYTKELVIPGRSVQDTYGGWDLDWHPIKFPLNELGSAYIRYTWGTEDFPEWPTDGLIVGKKDGFAEGDKRKQNYGQQITKGGYYFDFFNVETEPAREASNKKRLFWTETGRREFRAYAWRDIVDITGNITAILDFNGTFVVFTDKNMQTFAGTAEPDAPIVPITTFHDVGCLSWKAYDRIDNTLFFIGQEDVFMWDGQSAPIPITGLGMREEIFKRSAGDFVTDISDADYTPIPILRIDKKNKDVYVYTRDKIVYVYNIERGAWSYIDFPYDVNGNLDRIIDMHYFDGEMFFSTKTQKVLSTLGTGATYDYTVTLDLPLIEIIDPRIEVLVESLNIRHKMATSKQFTVMISRTGTDTFTEQTTVTVPARTELIKTEEIPLWQTSGQLRIRLTSTNSGFNLYSLSLVISASGEDVETVKTVLSGVSL